LNLRPRTKICICKLDNGLSSARKRKKKNLEEALARVQSFVSIIVGDIVWPPTNIPIHRIYLDQKVQSLYEAPSNDSATRYRSTPVGLTTGLGSAKKSSILGMYLYEGPNHHAGIVNDD
jgi:hypothetical protein